METDVFAFGEFIATRRKERGITLRGFAEKLDIAPAYLSDIEKGRRYAPAHKLDAIARLLVLTTAEREQLFDLAARTRDDQVSSDLSGYIMETDMARVALRRARDAGLSPDGWEKVLRVISEESTHQ